MSEYLKNFLATSCFSAAVFNMSVMLILLHWTPTVEHKAYLYLFAILWGMGDAVWQTQING